MLSLASSIARSLPTSAAASVVACTMRVGRGCRSATAARSLHRVAWHLVCERSCTSLGVRAPRLTPTAPAFPTSGTTATAPSLQLFAASASRCKTTTTNGNDGGKANKKSARKEKLMAERKEIQTELQHSGYYDDFGEYKKNKGKRSQAPTSLTLPSKAKRFPMIAGRDLAGNNVSLPAALEGKACLYLVNLRGIARPVLDAYREGLEPRIAHDITVFEVSVVERRVYQLMARLLERSLRNVVPSEQHTSMLVHCPSNAKQLREDLDVMNAMAAYVYLVDKNGLVRWKAHGPPSARELDSLNVLGDALLKE
eukprot:m.226315 g.226315  ORF g.226315 m.226315 type:complete len:311 (+) comp18795_c0_seq6:3298-4230(+)